MLKLARSSRVWISWSIKTNWRVIVFYGHFSISFFLFSVVFIDIITLIKSSHNFSVISLNKLWRHWFCLVWKHGACRHWFFFLFIRLLREIFSFIQLAQIAVPCVGLAHYSRSFSLSLWHKLFVASFFSLIVHAIVVI